ncbi:hypothetical protein Q6346_07395 [Isoptericola sp. b490]|uniref:hypothetical protein n=1 Tax=Actinotalea lenta TaxID=3064654 RepID=UPI002713DA36|nr:hypothetical protein [Isoptericola sp. b490]MDO8121137.1 hypothetical protein [Isoptericola sp. b490]
MSRTNYIRLGSILTATATGALALVHRLWVSTTRLPPGVELAVAVLLIVIGLPLLVRGLRHRPPPSG